MGDPEDLAGSLATRRRDGDDLRSVKSVEWGLWATLMCMCHNCDSEYALPHWSEPPWNGDVVGWSKQWAPIVHQLGRIMAPDCFNLLCPNCSPPA
jgi:hypothetical protein